MIKINKEEFNQILSYMKWSYSRLNSYHTCKWMFYVTYILKQKGENNAFAEWGTFLHSIMEKYDKNELSEWELVDYYANNYSENVTLDFPPNKWVSLSDSYYQSGLEYLSNFE